MNKDERPKHRAKKSLGQNFLQDENICRKIVSAIDPRPDDFIIEIGPGQGALTRYIVDSKPGRFLVIEMDDELADRLGEDYPGLEIERQDALKFPWDSLTNSPCKIVGNLPYNIGSKLIWDIVSRVGGMDRAVFMVQHEVATRLTAEPGTKAYGALTAWVKNYTQTRYLFKVPPTVFHPRPKVDSAVVSFTPLGAEMLPEHPERLSALLKMLFQQRRKQVSTILKQRWTPEINAWFAERGIDTRVRPENLTPEQLLSLSDIV